MSIPCPLCNDTAQPQGWSIPDRMFGLPGKFDFARCRGCSSLLLVDIPENLTDYYPPDAYYSYHLTANPSHIPPPTKIDARLATGDLQGSTILDVGCGNGAALDYYRCLDWCTWGVEWSAEAAREAETRGHSVRTGSFPEVSLPSRHFDLIRMRHVLEHLSCTKRALRFAAELLTPSGWMFLEIPHIGSWLAKFTGAYYWQLDAPRHQILASREALGRLLRDVGLDIEVVTTTSPAKGLAYCLSFMWQEKVTGRTWMLSSENKPRGFRWFLRLGRIFGRVADALDRGDNICILARKTGSKR